LGKERGRKREKPSRNPVRCLQVVQGGNVTRKRKAKKGIPNLTDGMKFDRTLQEVPEQRVAARE